MKFVKILLLTLVFFLSFVLVEAAGMAGRAPVLSSIAIFGLLTAVLVAALVFIERRYSVRHGLYERKIYRGFGVALIVVGVLMAATFITTGHVSNLSTGGLVAAWGLLFRATNKVGSHSAPL